ncbi:hypothetical protein B0H12DRAFT_1159641 [Mycena haematopus]|nr:hypothetical protein B0H12DRAFT_1159641 [Mycena haematopus]
MASRPPVHQSDVNQRSALALTAQNSASRKCKNCEGQILPHESTRFVKCAACRAKDRDRSRERMERRYSRTSEMPTDGLVERIRAQESEISRLQSDIYQLQAERVEMVDLVRSLQNDIHEQQVWGLLILQYADHPSPIRSRNLKGRQLNISVLWSPRFIECRRL